MNHTIIPPSSYINPEKHIEVLLHDPWYRVIYKIHSQILKLTHDFYAQEGIGPIIFPVTTGSVSSPMGLGSDSLPVKIKFEHTGQNTYLADSMQFSLELGARLDGKGSYYVMPTYRGEDIDARHLNEFTHSEVEIIGELNDVMELGERYIKYLNRGMLESCKSEIISVVGDVDHIEKYIDTPFASIDFKQALEELKPHEGAYEQLATGDYGITPAGEKILMQTYGDFLWLKHMPWGAVPFYQKQYQSDPEFSCTADLLAGIGEIIGGGQRTVTGGELDESLKVHEVELHGYEWYRKMHDDHPVQTSGFGLGVERYILWLLQHDDIRDCTLLLRDHKEILFP